MLCANFCSPPTTVRDHPLLLPVVCTATTSFQTLDLACQSSASFCLDSHWKTHLGQHLSSHHSYHTTHLHLPSPLPSSSQPSAQFLVSDLFRFSVFSVFPLLANYFPLRVVFWSVLDSVLHTVNSCNVPSLIVTKSWFIPTSLDISALYILINVGLVKHSDCLVNSLFLL